MRDGDAFPAHLTIQILAYLFSGPAIPRRGQALLFYGGPIWAIIQVFHQSN